MTEEKSKNRWKTFTEEVEVAGHQLIDEVTRLVSEGNVHKLRVRSQNSDVVFEVPLTAGAVVGGVFVLAAPALAVLGALAGLLAKVKIEIVRNVDADEDAEDGDDFGDNADDDDRGPVIDGEVKES
ncbi:MAG: DUF4342 domain-containing protein [Devosiaceae bacterium]|nr:DUF4342 domain-containing protein [Devosiaceae bacterium]